MARNNDSLGNAQIAYERIREAIVEGRFSPGQRLIEQRIAEEFGLSRTPVREALRRLEAEALVRSELNRGAVVRSVTENEIRDLYELRAHLESLAAGRAASRITAEQQQRLDAAVQEFDDAVANASPHELESLRAISRANQLVHGLIVEASHHERLADLLHRTVDVPLVYSAFAQFDEEELHRSALFHRLIAAAIASGDAERAALLIREHIYQGRDQLLAGLAENAAQDAAADDPKTPARDN
ncbi:MAG: GntR family transcriptional regulator [Marmoricola sp.]